MTHVCEYPPGIFIIVNYIISAHCQPHRGFYNNNNNSKNLYIASWYIAVPGRLIINDSIYKAIKWSTRMQWNLNLKDFLIKILNP